MRPTDDIEFYLKLVNRLENKINVIKNVVGLDQGVLQTEDVNPIEFLDTIYKKGELPDSDDDLLALEDDHILELRRFLAENSIDRQQFVKSIPVGKWNYLPEESHQTKKVLSLAEVEIEIDKSIPIKEHVFSITDTRTEYTNQFIDVKSALDLLHTTSNNNNREIDSITVDRSTVERISLSQAKREAKNNPNRSTLKPAQKKFLTGYKLHKETAFDLLRLFEEGITDSIDQKEFNRIVFKGNKELKEHGHLMVSTIIDTEQLIIKLQQKEVGTREIKSTKGVLYYASKN
jgi:hypothetical protein